MQEIDGQVDPQSATKAFRPAGTPLKGAMITQCEQISANTFDLKYAVGNQTYEIKYFADLSSVQMTFVAPDGSERTESYMRK